MKLSICVYIKDVGEYLPKYFESVLGQTHLPDEVILIDDGSQDLSPEIISQFKSQSKSEVYLIQHQKPVGETRSYLEALQKASGNLILFSRGDEIHYPYSFEKFHALFDKEPLMRMSLANAELIDGEGNKFLSDFFGRTRFYERWDYHKELSSILTISNKFLPAFLLAIDRKFTNKILEFTEEYPTWEHDIDFGELLAVLFGLHFETESLREIPYVLTKYRIVNTQDLPFEVPKQTSSWKEQMAALKQKRNQHIEDHFDWLQKYYQLLLLIDAHHPIRNSIEKIIDFYAWRKSLLPKKPFSHTADKIKRAFRGDYRKYSKQSLKNFILDLL